MFTTLLAWSRSILKFGDAVIDVFETTVSDMLGIYGDKLPEAIGGLSMFEFIAGGGIVFILTYSLVSWVIDILP